MSRALLLLVTLTLTLTAWASLARAQPLRERGDVPRPSREHAERVLELLGPEHLLREAWRVTRRHHYDPDRAGVDWDALLARHLPRVAGAERPQQVYAAVNRMLGELDTSHLTLFAGGVWSRELAQEFTGRATPRLGCELVDIGGRLFVDGLVEGGAAEQAGLLEGDEVVALDGARPLASGLLEEAGHDPALGGPAGYSVQVGGGPLVLTVRRRAAGPARDVQVTPIPTSLIGASRRSARLASVATATGSVTVGVVHLWHFIRAEIAADLERALRGPLAAADALVLDVRGRGGTAAVVQAVLDLFRGERPVWTKPVVCLTDRGTRSAKEIFAWHWKRLELGPIVGERTAGACVGCAFHQLSDGSVLALPVQDVRRLTRGVDLEGVGVAPTDPVADAPLPYRAGADPILAAGLERAAALCGARAAAPF